MKSNALQMRDYYKLITVVYKDAVIMCSAGVSHTQRDLETIKLRIKDEGLSFLTITLPRFAKDFERSLANGRIDSTLFEGFRRVKRGSIPAFLQGMISLIFDSETGELFQNEQIPIGDSTYSSVVDGVRQICRFFHKTEFVCAPKRVHAAVESFVAIEQSFDTFTLQDDEQSKFLDFSDMLWGNAFAEFNLSKCVPKHGPGATADGISGNRKYVWQRWHDRLEPYFPLIGVAYPLGTEPDSKEVQIVTIVSVDQEQPVKVITVPKTQKAPRIIAIEPCCMQYAQQGVRDYLYETIQSYALTKWHVNFTSQEVNRTLALEASATGQYSTIDLSDASDRVPRDLALGMFRTNPDLREAIEACRSSSAELPDGRVISPLRKFAAMGSALCFPVEAMYFYTICVMAILEARKLSKTFQNIFEVSRDVYVYGDDIIVPSTNADVVVIALQKYHCKVNTTKTFVTGKFRESCGMDAYDGKQVTPVYLTSELPNNKQQSSSLLSTVATANQLYLRGFWRAADFLYKHIEGIVGFIPYIRMESEALGRISYLGFRSVSGWNWKFQCLKVRALVPKPIYRTDKLDGYAALSKCLLRLESSSDEDGVTMRNHLERSALYGAVTLKRRWVTA